MSEEEWCRKKARLEMAIENVIVDLIREHVGDRFRVATFADKAVSAFNELIHEVEDGRLVAREAMKAKE